jgi:hypothetical protein
MGKFYWWVVLTGITLYVGTMIYLLINNGSGVCDV